MPCMETKPILPHMTPDQRERFWSYVNQGSPDGCWPWLSTCNVRTHYGTFEVMRDAVKTKLSTHRVAYALTHGEPPRLVLHTCDNRPCCNPAHLYDGTHADNARDMMSRGRHRTARAMRGRKGSAHPRAMAEHDNLKAQAIALYQERWTFAQIAGRLGVHSQTVMRWWRQHVERLSAIKVLPRKRQRSKRAPIRRVV